MFARKGFHDATVKEIAAAAEFSVGGVLSALSVPLAEAGVSVFPVSALDTDYLRVKDRDLLTALDALHNASHVVSEAGVQGPGQPR